MKKLILFTIICICSLCLGLYGQSEEPYVPRILDYKKDSEHTVVSAQDYVLMPGDTILITITGSTNYSYMTTVTPEGKITIQMPTSFTSVSRPLSPVTPTTQFAPQYDVVSAVPMHDITLEAAKDSLKYVFLKYFKHIDVDITLLFMRTFMVIVAGEVNRPGIAYARPIDRVSTVLDTIGGVAAIGSRSKIELRRKGKLYKVVDLEEFERTGNTEVNPYLHDGDVIYVPRMEKSVVVIGAVHEKTRLTLLKQEKPVQQTDFAVLGEKTSERRYELIEGETVSDIIAKTRLTPWVDLANAFIKRGNQTIVVNLAEVIVDESSTYNIEMKDGDILYIPAINAVVYVEGQVTNPGPYVFQPNLRVSDYIGFAGGTRAEGSRSNISIQRGEKRISAAGDPVVEQGDRIYVPRIFLKFWEDYLEIGSVFASVLISYLTYRAVTSN
jgi:protein involved in polysaccharide export with SLBB domain